MKIEEAIVYCLATSNRDVMNRIESEKMRAVMRWAGPRMILYHPIEAIKHLKREKF